MATCASGISANRDATERPTKFGIDDNVSARISVSFC
jgi:hypothetical protein